MTAHELMQLPDDGFRHELVHGELVKSAPTGHDHGAISANITGLLRDFVRPRHLGRIVTAETGFILARAPDTVRAPDVAFIGEGRIAAHHPGYVPFAPDLAVEVVSPSDRPDDVQRKVLEYLSAGTRMVWVVYPETQTVMVWRSPQSIRVARGDEQLVGDDVIPGFACKVAEVFE